MTTKPGAVDAPEDGIALHPVEAYRASDELYQAFPNEAVRFGIDPEDGLPSPTILNPMKDAEAPPLDPERFICMAIRTRFVLRNSWGDEVHEIPADQVERAPDGRYRTAWKNLWQIFTREDALALLGTSEDFNEWRSDDTDGAQTELVYWDKRRGSSEPVVLSRLLNRDVLREYLAGWIEVEPLRPQCRHYRRQFQDFPDTPGRHMVIRLCTARMTDEGEFLSLRDQEMLGCEIRSPSIGNQAHLMDEYDAVQVAKARKQKTADAEFDIDGALARERTQEPGER